MSALAPSMQAYFTDRLIAQRGASPTTIAAYCQTFRLLLGFASKRTGKPPSGRPPGSWTLDRLGLSGPAGRMWCPCPGRVRRTPRSSVVKPSA